MQVSEPRPGRAAGLFSNPDMHVSHVDPRPGGTSVAKYTGEWTVTSLTAQPPQPLPPPPRAHGKKKNSDVQSNHHQIASTSRNKRSIYQLHAGIGGWGWGLFFDASKQYTCLQCPWSPSAKYISHIPTAPFNPEKCKERPTRPVLCAAGRGGDAQ